VLRLAAFGRIVPDEGERGGLDGPDLASQNTPLKHRVNKPHRIQLRLRRDYIRVIRSKKLLLARGMVPRIPPEARGSRATLNLNRGKT
jgi:hypothetical protein